MQPDLSDMLSIPSALTRLVSFVYLASFFTPSFANLSINATDIESRAKHSADATPAAPHFVVYSDEWVSGENGPPDVSVVNVSPLLLSLLLCAKTIVQGFNTLYAAYSLLGVLRSNAYILLACSPSSLSQGQLIKLSSGRSSLMRIVLQSNRNMLPLA